MAMDAGLWPPSRRRLRWRVSVGETVGIDVSEGAKCWSEWQDLNLRPPRPERGALPDCATLRLEAGLITPAPLNASLRKAMTAQPGTRVLKADPDAIEAAARCLGTGGLVAFPTETVYGLGADAGNGETVARLYAAKGRPSFNPLIAHVAN